MGEDPVTGLLLKSKLDLVHRNRLVIDLKSTSQRTHADFLKSLSTYDYDRQAAFYLDSIQARRFMFIGVQKIRPYNIWIVEPSAGFIETGRRKYRALLREWKKRDQVGDLQTTDCGKLAGCYRIHAPIGPTTRCFPDLSDSQGVKPVYRI